MINETSKDATDTTETGAVEIQDEALDTASGGAIYMKVDGVKGSVQPVRPTESLSINFTKIEVSK